MKTKQPELKKSLHSTRDYPVMMSKAVTPSTGGYEKKDKNGNPTGKYTNAQDNYTCSTYSKAKNKVNWNYQ